MTSESNLEPDIVFPSDDAADNFGAADEEDMDNFGAFDDFGAYEEEANTYPAECAHLRGCFLVICITRVCCQTTELKMVQTLMVLSKTQKKSTF